MRFQGFNKRPSEGQELNALVANLVKEVLKSNKRAKAKAEHDYVSEDVAENFNFENLSIREE